MAILPFAPLGLAFAFLVPALAARGCVAREARLLALEGLGLVLSPSETKDLLAGATSRTEIQMESLWPLVPQLTSTGTTETTEGTSPR